MAVCAPIDDDLYVRVVTAIDSDGRDRLEPLAAVTGGLARAESGRPEPVPTTRLRWMRHTRAYGSRLPRWLRMAIAMMVVLVVYGSWQVLSWGPSQDRVTIADVFFYVAAGAAVSTAWFASRRCRSSPKLRRAWRLFAAS
jgi:hypothetical protein